MINDGYTVLRDMPSRQHCDGVVRDYYRYCEEQYAMRLARLPAAELQLAYI